MLPYDDPRGDSRLVSRYPMNSNGFELHLKPKNFKKQLNLTGDTVSSYNIPRSLPSNGLWIQQFKEAITIYIKLSTSQGNSQQVEHGLNHETNPRSLVLHLKKTTTTSTTTIRTTKLTSRIQGEESIQSYKFSKTRVSNLPSCLIGSTRERRKKEKEREKERAIPNNQKTPQKGIKSKAGRAHWHTPQGRTCLLAHATPRVAPGCSHPHTTGPLLDCLVHPVPDSLAQTTPSPPMATSTRLDLRLNLGKRVRTCTLNHSNS